MIKPRTDDIDVSAEMNGHDKRLIILTRDKKYIYILIDKDRIKRLEVETPDDIKPGDIFAAKVANINKSLSGAFVFLKHGVQICFFRRGHTDTSQYDKKKHDCCHFFHCIILATGD